LDDLEEGGLIVRHRDQADRRRHVVEMTAEGRKALARARRLSSRLEDEFLASLDEKERAQLHTLLVRLGEQHLPHCRVAARA
jgi:DNA-binding MarR family transcriptional regulator